MSGLLAISSGARVTTKGVITEKAEKPEKATEVVAEGTMSWPISRLLAVLVVAEPVEFVKV